MMSRIKSGLQVAILIGNIYDGAHIEYGKLDNNKYDDNKYNTEKSVELRNVNKRRSRLMKDERRER